MSTLGQTREKAGICASTYSGAGCGTYSKHWGCNCPASLPPLWPHPPLHQQQGCWSRSSIVQLLFLSLSRRQTTPYLPSLCSHRLARSQPFPLLPCSWTCPNHFLYHYWLCDYSFRSLFPELSRGCSSCSVSVRINLLTSISQTVALTGRLNWFHKKGRCCCKAWGRLAVIQRRHESWPRPTIKTINNSSNVWVINVTAAVWSTVLTPARGASASSCSTIRGNDYHHIFPPVVAHWSFKSPWGQVSDSTEKTKDF